MILIWHPMPVYHHVSFRKQLLRLASLAQFSPQSDVAGGKMETPFPKLLCAQVNLSIFLDMKSRKQTETFFNPKLFH